MDMKEKLEVIAEIGVNHGGSIDIAKQMIDAAKKSGASAVKFQSFSADRLASPDLEKVQYQRRSAKDKLESQRQMLRRLEIGPDALSELCLYSNSLGVECFTTPYSIQDMESLAHLGFQSVKIASADIVDLELVAFAAKSGARVLLSTGMANFSEIDEAVQVLEDNNANFILLHSTSSYPAPANELNLTAIAKMRERYNCEVGYSDHSLGKDAAMIAVALGTRLFERHFTLDKLAEGPDHLASADPKEFSDYVSSLNATLEMLGDGQKNCMPSEAEMRLKARKKIIAAVRIDKGRLITRDLVTLSRSNGGMTANKLKHIVGTRAKKGYEVGEVILDGDD